MTGGRSAPGSAGLSSSSGFATAVLPAAVAAATASSFPASFASLALENAASGSLRGRRAGARPVGMCAANGAGVAEAATSHTTGQGPNAAV